MSLARSWHSSLPPFITGPVFLLVAALTMQAQGPTQHNNQDQPIIANLPHMYEHAFRVQSSMAAQAKDSAANFRTVLQSRLHLTNEQFEIFKDSASRFDQVDQNVDDRAHSIAEGDKATHPTAKTMSEGARAQIHALIAERVKAANDEIEKIHQALEPANAGLLDDSVVRLYSSAQEVRISKSQKANSTSRNMNTGTLAGSANPLISCLCDDYDDDDDDGPPGSGGGDGGSPPPPPTNPAFTVDYESYIPQDHIYGPAPTGCSLQIGYIYLGDRQLDPPADGSPYSFRTLQSYVINPNSETSGSAGNATGYTEQFSTGSPVSNGYITNADYDGIANDCHLWNNWGHALFGENTNYANATITQATTASTLNLNGQAQNPLQTIAGHIAWNVSITINNTGDSATGQVFVSGGVTCYPSHQITVNGFLVATYIAPQDPSALYLARCLVSYGPRFPLSGLAIQPGGTPVSVY